MTKLLARTLSFTFAPALIALVGIGGSALCAVEPQNVPAKPAVVAGTTGSTSDGATGHSAKSKGAKHHKHHHHHKGASGRKQS